MGRETNNFKQQDTSLLLRTIRTMIDAGCAVILADLTDPQKNGYKAPYCGPDKQGFPGFTKKRYDYDYIASLIASAPNENIFGIGIVMGELSGNMETIDIDEHHAPGTWERYRSDIQSLYPAIWEKLRIDKTPRGGRHIRYYRETKPQGNQKLCVIGETNEAAIETRGNTYAIVPPSPGYEVVTKIPIPRLTDQEADDLINLAKTYDERVKQAVQPKKTKKEQEIYAETPFEQFNREDQGLMLQERGWNFHSENDRYVQWRYPSKTSGSLSASYNKEKGWYRAFSTSTEMEEGKIYDPVALLKLFEGHKSYSDTSKYLIQQGYGQFKKSYEEKIIKQAVQLGHDQLPPNVSDEAKKNFEKQSKQRQEAYPYGIWWTFGERGAVEINRNKFYDYLHHMGYRRWQLEIYKIYDQCYLDQMHEYTEIIPHVQKYLKAEEEEFIRDKIYGAADKFFEKSNKHIARHIAQISDKKILKDDFGTCYKRYRNGLLKITKDNATFVDEHEIGKFILPSKIIDRDYIPNDNYRDTKFPKFVANAIMDDEEYREKIFGYLLHDYRHAAISWALLFTDNAPADRSGGTGKNLLIKLLGQMYGDGIYEFDGDKADKKDEIFQAWQSERVVHLDDVSKFFTLSSLKAIITGTLTVRRLYQNAVKIDEENIPKIIITGNYGFDIYRDGGVKRRARLLSFTNYYHDKGGVDKAEGGLFPQIWTEHAWTGYDTYMVKCIQKWLGSMELGYSSGESLQASSQKNFDYVYDFGNDTFREWLDDMIEIWAERDYVRPEEIMSQYKNVYVPQSNTKKEMHIRTLHEAIAIRCESKGWEYKVSQRVWDRSTNPSQRTRASVILVPGREKNIEIVEEEEGIEELPF